MCRNGHEINGPQDRTHNGDCLHCRRARQREYMAECRQARRTLRQLQAVLA
jgi:hypothetical protein